ncbi:PTS sugar transporter subunit IIA [Paenibacillus lentus]|uniref:PTS fructose transporter subunit IIA n=1 Tax=Paenibacillus lentus TaxID=1338368 RepID=A0A3Q8S5R9_9BACL|nr:fructose PTS transporter subunit IIA [Paenibacillus lentus]AZK47614.1 PTS fructose transporter subunit IIA [Paenibacillus lentus]
MKIIELMNEEAILMPLNAANKENCIHAMIDALAESGAVTDKTAYLEAVMNREQMSSTGIGFRVAIPHGKSAGVTAPALAFAQLTEPLDWESIDGQPVSIVFMIAVPEQSQGNEHLQILVALSRKLMDDEFRNQLLAVRERKELIELLGTI